MPPHLPHRCYTGIMTMHLCDLPNREPERRELIEVVDFDSFLFKLRDYNVQKSLQSLLQELRN